MRSALQLRRRWYAGIDSGQQTVQCFSAPAVDVGQPFEQGGREHRRRAIDMQINMNPIEGRELQLFAERVSEVYRDWFGPPADPHWPAVLVAAAFEKCVRNFVLREYTVSIYYKLEREEEKKASIAHELYHRATMRFPGLRKQMWLDELLAFLATMHILKREGLTEFAEAYRNSLCLGYAPMDVHSLQRSRTKRSWRTLGGIVYPPRFLATVANVGTALDNLLEWHEICGLVTYREWRQWLNTLPPDVRPQTIELLGIPER